MFEREDASVNLINRRVVVTFNPFTFFSVFRHFDVSIRLLILNRLEIEWRDI